MTVSLGVAGILLAATAATAALRVVAQNRPRAPAPGYIEQGAKLEATKHRFTPDSLTFRAGIPITIVLSSLDGSHSFAVEGLDVRSAEAGSGESVVVEFLVGEPGAYEFYCAHGDHREKGMTGRLTITP
jgi:plastocyanin